MLKEHVSGTENKNLYVELLRIFLTIAVRLHHFRYRDSMAICEEPLSEAFAGVFHLVYGKYALLGYFAGAVLMYYLLGEPPYFANGLSACYIII